MVTFSSSFFLFLFSLSFVSAGILSDYNISLQSQQDFCSTQNLSFTSCFNFWQKVESYDNHTSLNSSVFCNYSDYIFKNQSNITYQNITCDFDKDLLKIKEMSSLNFMPIFNEGKVVNWQPIPVKCYYDNLINISDCEIQKSNSYQSGVQSVKTLVEEPDSSFSYWWFLLIPLGFFLFLYQKGYFSKSSRLKPISPPYSYQEKIDSVPSEEGFLK